MPLLLLLVSILFANSVPAAAAEFSLLGGVIHKAGHSGSSYSGQMEFRGDLVPHVQGSLSYVNEGHLPGDRQDGYLAQVWGTYPATESFSLALGVGPYLYFNTIKGDCNPSHCNEHGVGIVTSGGASMETEKGWLLHLRGNWVRTTHSDTVSAMIGVGYRFRDNAGSREVKEAREPLQNEITILAGQTTVNSLKSEHSPAFSVEYRRSLHRHVEASVGWLYEGDARLLRRSGVTGQLWGRAPLLNDRLSIGIGAGVYFASDHYSGISRSQRFSPIATLTASLRIADHWSLRTSWHRVITVYDGDTDVIMGGVGYLF